MADTRVCGRIRRLIWNCAFGKKCHLQHSLTTYAYAVAPLNTAACSCASHVSVLLERPPMTPSSTDDQRGSNGKPASKLRIVTSGAPGGTRAATSSRPSRMSSKQRRSVHAASPGSCCRLALNAAALGRRQGRACFMDRHPGQFAADCVIVAAGHAMCLHAPTHLHARSVWPPILHADTHLRACWACHRRRPFFCTSMRPQRAGARFARPRLHGRPQHRCPYRCAVLRRCTPARPSGWRGPARL
mmetsp:Transcript_20360/g.60526  ORF Transcript_20360/g.60526 Transcript_20360/m.60526 type:complete len:244 (+) Transcript_20360:961-1692(+)